jgi:hypothetical protein
LRRGCWVDWRAFAGAMSDPGRVAEWLKAPVSKTGIPVNPVS